MEVAAKILILGGLVSILYGLLTGIPAGIIRQNNPTYSKYLRFAHIGALMWGPILISMALATELSTLNQGLETSAAWLLVLAAFALSAKDTINWLLKIEDEFAQLPKLPLALGGLSGVMSLVGVSILLFGVVSSL